MANTKNKIPKELDKKADILEDKINAAKAKQSENEISKIKEKTEEIGRKATKEVEEHIENSGKEKKKFECQIIKFFKKIFKK